MNILEVNNLKTYFYTSNGVVKAVDDVSFNIEKGKVKNIADLLKKSFVAMHDLMQFTTSADLKSLFQQQTSALSDLMNQISKM